MVLFLKKDKRENPLLAWIKRTIENYRMASFLPADDSLLQFNI